ncbi:MAG: DNA-directed RNA polymerase subunit omega [bacterium]|nr:MAG: DNA-directed RNA polymerase subunit omega [bacterium]
MDLNIIEDALKKYPNRFFLTMMAAARAKELNEGEKTLLKRSRGDKPIVQALEELAEGIVVPCSKEEMEQVREERRLARERALMEAEEEEAMETDELDASSSETPTEA